MDKRDPILDYLGRDTTIFDEDIAVHESELSKIVKGGKFLVIGGAGSIGQAVVRELFLRNPRVLHVVDISENSMVEVVRDLRSTIGYTDGEFKTFCIDCGGVEFEALVNSAGPYDYVFNLSALKHVRSERDPFTLMRMIEVNILNTLKTIELTQNGLTKYFCVSTDKAANPANMMGASKRIMEMYLLQKSSKVSISTARFANVAFSNGSLPDGFRKRLQLRQPISAPSDVLRYFVTAQEGGQLCLLSGLLGESNDIYFPNNESLTAISFASIADRFLEHHGYQPVQMSSEAEARERAEELIEQNKWPVYFSASDTTGEKPCEEFFTDSETVDLSQYSSVGVVANSHMQSAAMLVVFLEKVERMRVSGAWSKQEIVDLFVTMVPTFSHIETGKYLDEKM